MRLGKRGMSVDPGNRIWLVSCLVRVKEYPFHVRYTGKLLQNRKLGFS